MQFSTNHEDFRSKVVAVVTNTDSGERGIPLGRIGYVRAATSDGIRVRFSAYADGSRNRSGVQWTFAPEDLAIIEEGDSFWYDGARQDVTGTDQSDPYAFIRGRRSDWLSVNADVRACPAHQSAVHGEQGSLSRIVQDWSSHRLSTNTIIKHTTGRTANSNADSMTTHNVTAGRPSVSLDECEPLRIGDTLTRDGVNGRLIAMLVDYDEECPLLVHGMGWVRISDVVYAHSAGDADPSTLERYEFGGDVDPKAIDPIDVLLTFTAPIRSLGEGVNMGRTRVNLTPLLADGLSAQPVDEENAEVTVSAVYGNGSFRIGSSVVPARDVPGESVKVARGPEKETFATMNTGLWKCLVTEHQHGLLVFGGDEPSLIEYGPGSATVHTSLPSRDTACRLALQTHEDYLLPNRTSVREVTIPVANGVSDFGGSIRLVRRAVRPA